MPGIRVRAPGTARRLEDAPERHRRRYEHNDKLVRETYVGVRATTGLEEGLYPIASTGLSNEPIRTAVQDFLASLNDQQRATASFSIDSDEWRRWNNTQNFLMRHGVCLDDLDGDQRQRALAILRAGLSEAGYQTGHEAMHRTGLLGEIAGTPEEFGEWLYWISVFGTPSSSEPWGWQIDGHHVNVSYLVLGDQIVMTPIFLGSEPALPMSDIYPGQRLLEHEESAGYRFITGLDAAQNEKAFLGSHLMYEVYTGAFRDNVELDYTGIAYRDLQPTQQRELLDLLAIYANRMPAGHAAQQKMTEVRRHLDETYFAWMGDAGEQGAFYYRLHNPVLLAEFSHIAGVVYDNDEPSRDHIHTLVRSPNGNDYGKELLRQHYA